MGDEEQLTDDELNSIENGYSEHLIPRLVAEVRASRIVTEADRLRDEAKYGDPNSQGDGWGR